MSWVSSSYKGLTYGMVSSFSANLVCSISHRNSLSEKELALASVNVTLGALGVVFVVVMMGLVSR